MAIWKDLITESSTDEPETAGEKEHSLQNVSPLKEQPKGKVVDKMEKKESILSAGLTIEGKIEGEGDVRIAGRFKGDIRVRGSVIMEPRAHVSGEVSADSVTVGGEVEGNVTATTRVTLLETGQLIGDLAAKSLTVAAGSRMRGRVEFGWDEIEVTKLKTKKAAAAGEVQ